mmetsp:Transcript_11229/g.18604  ORF Transcript_11229/g.18604 Transcript_11229/m.18604 type:complete len:560 (-) Transcript_11229:22-1701(-)
MDLFIDGKSVKVDVHVDQTCEHEHATSVSARALEDAIESFAVPTKLDNTVLDIVLCSRYDCHLLDCRRSPVPVDSILGVIEESVSMSASIDSIADEKQIDSIQIDSVNLLNPFIDITLMKVEGSRSSSCQSSSNATSIPEPPHRDWIRIRSRTVPVPTDHADITSTDMQKEQEQPNNKALWVHLHNTEMDLSTQADCCHFLRSILGSCHDASPWGHSDTNANVNTYSLVAVVLRNSSETLEKFRTTDASPSYFLHSISRLQIPAQNPRWWSQSSSASHGAEMLPATLLIYRKLPPRDSFTLQQPENYNETLPEACMWESYFRQDDQDDDADDNVDDTNGAIQMKEFWRQVAPPYINCAQDYPNMIEPLIEKLSIIREEALSIPQWTAWPEKNHYSSNPNDPDSPTWTVFPLCHCFPANQVENRKWIDVTCSFVPKTIAILREHLGDTLRTALFSRLDPETTLEAHSGWEDLANHVYRLHLPLVVPPGGLCGAWVDGAVETHEEGRALCFDDSKVHRAFNFSQQERIVLILDLARPAALPLGTASGGHTAELDDFINSLT